MLHFTKPDVTPLLPWTERHDVDVVVIGAGIAGLAFTLHLPPTLKVVLVTKGSLGESNTRYAQGGLAAAVGLDDDPELHLADTLAAGAGLCDEGAVRELVESGPDAVAWLLEHGTRFDRDDDMLALGREAAHSRHRVLHAGGDATGAEIERALVAQLRARDTVTIMEHTVATDLCLTETGDCGGVIVLDPDHEPVLLSAPVTVLANGGAGQLWSVTSNPPGATGDGIAMALRAGVTVADLEFTQFHPTVLAHPDATPFLISEAVRGEGAYLRAKDGSRFMVDHHPLAELAPRDVVARAIQDQMALDRTQSVSLDLRHIAPDVIRHRFPTIMARLAESGLDLARDLIPVAPAAHYFMGGIVAGTDGTASLPGLLAIGEVSCTGVHGANRLASNSLLEGLAFGLQAADRLADGWSWSRLPAKLATPTTIERSGEGAVDVGAMRAAIQRAMSADVAVVRTESGLAEAARIMDHALQEAQTALPTTDPAAWEISNMALLAHEIIASARARQESRGAHFRADYPVTDPALDGQHQTVTLDGSTTRREFDPLSRTLAPAHAD